MSDQTNTSAQHNAATKAAVINQLPSSEIQGQSPLHHVDFESLAQQNPEAGGVCLAEKKLLGHLTLRCNAANADQLAVVNQVLGIDLPLTPLTSVEKDGYSIRWLSPDEWLILVPGQQTFDIETRFRDLMPGHYSLVNSSGGSTVLELSGESVVEMLKKCTPVDLHIKHFPVGKVVSTVFAKSGAVIRRIEDNRFELVIRRTFADYIWLWIQDASQEFGLVIES